MELVHFNQGTKSEEFSPKFGSKKETSSSVQDIIAEARKLSQAFPTKKTTRAYSTALPRPKEHTYKCDTCGKAEVVQPFILPVGWYSLSLKVSGHILDGKMNRWIFCSKECLCCFVKL